MGAALTLAIASGCKKDEASPTKAPAPTAEAPKPAATACEAGAYGDPDGEFCLKLVAGYEAGKKQDTGDTHWYQTFSGAKGTLTVAADNTPEDFDTVVKSDIDGPATEKVVANIDLAGGKGKYIQKETPDKQTLLYAVIKGPKHTVQCKSNWSAAKAAPEIIDICKSLHAP
jgi:hypothetical protein